MSYVGSSTLQKESVTSTPIFNGITYTASFQQGLFNYLTSSTVLPNIDTNTCICNYEFTTAHPAFVFGPVSDGNYSVTVLNSSSTNTTTQYGATWIFPFLNTQVANHKQMPALLMSNAESWQSGTGSPSKPVYYIVTSGIQVDGFYIVIIPPSYSTTYSNNVLKITKIA